MKNLIQLILLVKNSGNFNYNKMIFFRKETQYYFENSKELIKSFAILLTSVILFVVVFNYDIESGKPYYATVDGLSVDKYKSPIKYTVKYDYKELEMYAEVNISEKKFNSLKVGQVVKNDLILSEIDNFTRVIISLILLFSAIACLFSLCFTVFFTVEWFCYIFKNYSLKIISRKKYNTIKQIDPYLEEIW